LLGLSHRSWPVRVARPAYDGLLGAVYGRSGVRRRIHGEEPIHLLPRYRSIGEDAEAAVFEALRRAVKPGDVVLDVGANVGVYSLLMARWAGERGRVFAFEPAPESRAALALHLVMNGMRGRVEVVPEAVSDEVGEATFFAATYSGENSMNPAFGKRVKGATAVRVPVTTIDAFCEGRGVAPSFIKIDIEGYEFHAIRGARHTLRAHGPTLLVELHPAVWTELGVGQENLAALASELGYHATPLGGAGAGDAATHVLLRAGGGKGS
jgi:FkbM family methyltransferase